MVTVPTYRVDVAREADLIEEVGRHFGFDQIPAAFPALTGPQPPPDTAIVRERVLRQQLVASGFSEAMTFAFVEREAAMPFVEPGAEPAAIANPLSEKYAVLRPSLLPGLIDSCAHNRRRARKDIRLFETGSRFVPATGEGRAAALAWCGAADGPHWSTPTRGVDFFDVKGVVESVCATFGVAAEFAAAEWPFLVRGRAARAYGQRDGASVPFAILGLLMPSIADARGFPSGEEIFVAEIDLQALFSLASGDDLRARVAAALSGDRPRRFDPRVRRVACGHGSWHYPFVSSADAGFDCRVRSLHWKGRSSRAGQPVAAPHLPRCRSHVDRRRGPDGDGDDRCRTEAGSRRRATLKHFSDFRDHRCGASRRRVLGCLRHSCG